MSGTEAFFDTNVLLYLIGPDLIKADAAQDLVSKGGTISVQVLNEFAAVAIRKYRIDWTRIRDVLATFRAAFAVLPLSVQVHENGLDLCERYKLGFYDALIVAAALQSGCKILFSEDLQHGQTIGGLTIHNPFRT